jgi:hypothetical protein
MNLALNNVTNVIDYYRAKREQVDPDFVAFGPGLNMLRTDSSPEGDRIKRLKDYAFSSLAQFKRGYADTSVYLLRDRTDESGTHPLASIGPVQAQYRMWSICCRAT